MTRYKVEISVPTISGVGEPWKFVGESNTFANALRLALMEWAKEPTHKPGDPAP